MNNGWFGFYYILILDEHAAIYTNENGLTQTSKINYVGKEIGI